MAMVWRWKCYESDATKLLRELLDEHPRIAQEQKEGRALWWDKNIDLEERERFRKARVKQPAYVYQNKM